jgi:hypothetical protein
MSNLKKVFVYTELQFSVPFEDVPWKKINDGIKKQEGFVRKTWLSGLNSGTVGGLYEFNSLESAQKFAWDYFPNEPRAFGVSFQTKLFDGEIVEAASRDMNSPHYD